MQLAIDVLHFNPPCSEATGVAQALLGDSDGPIHKQPSVNEWPFIVLLSYWSAPQWAMPPVTVKEGPLGKWLSKGGVVVISWKLREEVVSGILLEGLEITQPWTVGELDVPGNRLGTTSCSASQPSLRPSNNLGTGVEEQWTSPSSLSVQTTSSGPFSGHQSLRTGLLTWTAWGYRTCCVGCLAPSRMRAGQNVGTLTWRSFQMRSVSA